MTTIDKKDRAKLKECAKQYSEYPVYSRAVTKHRTHKNKKLLIPKGSFLYDIYRDNAEKMVIKKSTQTGISEFLICRVLYRAEQGASIFYVLPTYELKNQFVKERIDKTILLSPYYRMILSAAEKKMAESMSLKQIGAGVIAFVGSNTSNAFLSFAADDVIIDELDNCNQGNILMAEERQSASIDRMSTRVGNPTITGYGIDAEYSKSDKKKWHIKCSSCKEWITPDFFKHVISQVSDGNYVILDKKWDRKGIAEPKPICDLCRKPYDRYGNGEWVSEIKSEVSGYHVSKMFSTTITISDLLRRFSDGIVNETAMQRFYNGDLGLAYMAKGAKITSEMIDDCVADYIMPDSCDAPCVAGVDIGLINNVIIATYQEPMKVVYIGIARDILDILSLFKRFNVRCFVVDAQPERREAAKLCHRWKYGFMNFYGASKSKRDINIDSNTLVVTSNRTMALDSVKEKILMKAITFPADSKSIKGFYDQMQASTRVFDEERQEYNWEHGSEPDHYHHALAYMLIARRVMAMIK